VWLVALAVIVALDIGVARTVSGFKSRLGRVKTNEEFQAQARITMVAETLAIGALPMANLLAIGLLIEPGGDRRRRFFLGFEAFGATALALFIAGAILFPDELVRPYLGLVIGPFLQTSGTPSTTIRIRILYGLCAAMLVLPQVAFAVVGGILV